MSLKIAALPLDIEHLNPEANLARVEEALQGLPPGTDIVALPELFTSAFTPDRAKAREIAAFEDATLERLRSWTRRYNAAFAGSFMAGGQDGEFFNRAFMVLPDGTAEFYDKRHLFRPSGEADVFTAGSRRPPVVAFRGWNVRVAVCYDLRFPSWCRNNALEYDLLIVPANWGDARRYAFNSLLIARAIENQIFTVGVNRSGSDDYGSYASDMSIVCDHMGRPVSTTEGPFVTATLERDAMDRQRQRFPVWKDADRVDILL